MHVLELLLCLTTTVTAAPDIKAHQLGHHGHHVDQHSHRGDHHGHHEDHHSTRDISSASILPHTSTLWKEGMCRRISRQSTAAGYRVVRVGREVEEVEKVEEEEPKNVEEREGKDYHHHRHKLDQELASQQRAQERELQEQVAADKRPKCQPIGQELDCRCDFSSGLHSAGWCALWGCRPQGGVQQTFEVIGHWECLSWC